MIRLNGSDNKKKSKVLITGVNGFIGRHLVNYLFNNKEIQIYGIGTKDNYEGLEKISYIKTDISKKSSIEDVCSRLKCCDMILHLAALIDGSNNNTELIEVNCRGTLYITQMAEKLLCNRLVFLSSIPVIGEPQNIPIDESHPTDPRTLYHISKLAAEKIILLNEQAGYQAAVLRIPSPIGKNMNSNSIMSVFLKQAKYDEDIVLYGKGGRIQNYIDVRDICRAIWKTCESDKEGVYLIASKKSYSNRELAEICIGELNSKSTIQYNGKEDLQENDKWKININKALNELGFETEIALEDTIKWIMDRCE